MMQMQMQSGGEHLFAMSQMRKEEELNLSPTQPNKYTAHTTPQRTAHD
jgi:hypothetical protein